MRFLFPKKNKLKLIQQISEVFTNKKYLKENDIKLVFKKMDILDENKAAFFVPKRNIKSAVDRKKIKRLLSESFRLEFPLVKEKKGKFNLIFLYENHKIKKFEEIKITVKNLLKKLYN